MRKLLFLLFCFSLTISQVIAQNRTIKGKVTDDKGAPIPNASVLVKGTSIGVATGSDGTFSFSVPNSAKTLEVSSISFISQELIIGSKTTFNLSLQTATKNLDEVVVVGYGTQKKTNVTGAIATVKAADLENKPFTSVDKALQGAVAGLQSVAASGAPGANQQIRIRGVSSINASNNPLWVIDGVPANTGDATRLTTTANLLSSMNPDDIESITVLKDASSTAIYGSRGSNGVIIVTTKKGKAGVTKFRFDAEAGTSDIAYKSSAYRPLIAAEYTAITREGLLNAGYSQAVTDAQINALGGNSGVDFNWLDNVTRKGSQQQYNISASGGTEKTTFYISGGYFKQDGTTIATDMDRFNTAFRVVNKATDKLTLNMNMQIGSTKQNTPLSGGSFGNPVLSSYFLLPTRSAYKSDGSYNILTSDFPTSSSFNTVYLANTDKRLLKQLGVRGSASAEYKILTNLKFKSNLAGDYNTDEETQYNNPFYGDGAVLATGSPTYGNVVYNTATTGRIYDYYTRYFNYDWANTLDYNGKLTRNGDLSVNAQIGYESQLSKGYFISSQGTGFPLTLALTQGASTATPKTASSTISDYSFISQFASVGFNYKDRYILSGSFRRDGSSRFGENNRYGNFWSIGASWNLINEAFIKDINVITNLKLRASYGVTGNAGIGNYDWVPSYGSGYNYNYSPGTAPSNVGNPNLTWELNKPLNVGIEIGLLKNRLNFTVDYYDRKSTDLLLAVQLSRSSGFTSATQNIGGLYNKGLEVTINATPITIKDFKWVIDFNIATNKNVVTDLPNHADISSPVSTLFNLREGYSVQSYYLRQYAGVDPANGDPLWYSDPANSKATTNVYPGAASRIMDKNGLPTYFGALTNTFTFKNFSLSAQFYYSGGNYIYDGWGSYYVGAGYGATFNKVARVLDRWQKPGDITDIPKYVYGGNKSFQSSSSFYNQSGDFIRLRNIQLGYDIPKSVLTKSGIANVNFYVRGTNVWTWVKDKKLSFDPEQGTNNITNLDVMIPKTFTVGLLIGF